MTYVFFVKVILYIAELERIYQNIKKKVSKYEGVQADVIYGLGRNVIFFS